MMKSINPKEAVICGNYPSWIQEKYPDLKITQIMTYGQMWKKRAENNYNNLLDTASYKK
ncbi:MAG: hypothetical protein J5706_02850 [Elusimicrobiales bacterium]|nr:hypothetical protein [Elusimicrobiales bacterium]